MYPADETPQKMNDEGEPIHPAFIWGDEARGYPESLFEEEGYVIHCMNNAKFDEKLIKGDDFWFSTARFFKKYD